MSSKNTLKFSDRFLSLQAPETWLRILAIVLGVFAGVYLIALVTRWTAVPLYDHFVATQDLIGLRNGESVWETIFKQHNEHRMMPSRVLFLIDNFLFSGTQYFLYVCNYLLSIGIFAVLFGVFTKDQTHLERAVRLLASVALGLNTILALNLNWAFQSALFFPQLFLVIALSVIWHRDQVGWGRLSVAILLCSLAVISLGSGLVVPVIFVFMMVVRRFSILTIILTGLILASVTALHLATYSFPAGGSDSAANLGHRISFAVLVLTNIIPEYIGLVWRYVAVVFSLIIMTACLGMAYFKPNFLRRSQFLALGLALYCGGSAFALAIRRVDPNVLHFALGERYTMLGLLYWTCVGIAALWIYAYYKDNREKTSEEPPTLVGLELTAKLGLVAVIVSCVALAGDRLTNFRALQTVDNWKQNSEYAALSYSRNILTDEDALKLYPHAGTVRSSFEYLKANNHGVYSLAAFQSPGPDNNLIAAIKPDVEDCSSMLEQLSVTDTADGRIISVAGWAYSSDMSEINRGSIVLSDDTPVVEQLMSSPRSRKDVKKSFDLQSDKVGFQVRFRAADNVNHVRLILEDNDGDQCKLKFELPSLPLARAVTPTPDQRVSYLDSSISLEDGAQQPGVYPPLADELTALCAGRPLYGTLNGSQSGGTVIVDVPVGGAPETALSLITGPNSTNIAFQGVSTTGELGDIFQADSTHHKLTFLPLDTFEQGLPEGEPLAQIRMTDPGEGLWGVWSATCGLADIKTQ